MLTIKILKSGFLFFDKSSFLLEIDCIEKSDFAQKALSYNLNTIFL